MFGLILRNGVKYYSPILAIINKGWSTKMVVLDNKKENVILYKVWNSERLGKINRSIFILNASKSNWKKQNNIEGINEIICDLSILRKIKRKKTPKEILDIALKFNEEMKIKEWYPIDSEDDVESFNALSFGLHDAVIKSIVFDDRATKLFIDTSWQCDIIMRCYNVSETNLKTNEMYNDCEFEFGDKITFLPDDMYYDPKTHIERSKLVCDKIEYKLEKIYFEEHFDTDE